MKDPMPIKIMEETIFGPHYWILSLLSLNYYLRFKIYSIYNFCWPSNFLNFDQSYNKNIYGINLVLLDTL